MTPGWRLRMVVVLAATIVVHEGLLRAVAIVGVRPDPLLGLAVLAGLVGGSERGAVVGFGAGLAADLFLPTPFGLSALVLCVTGYVVGVVKTVVLPSSWGSRTLTMFGASAGGVGTFACFGALVGLPGAISPQLVTVMVVVGLTNAVFSAPLLRIVEWGYGPAPSSRSALDHSDGLGGPGLGSAGPTGLTRR